jgi:diguanylate cyclase (GGDEF)-like protein
VHRGVEAIVGIDRLPAPLLQFGPSGVVHANHAACEELRRSEEHLLGRGFVDSLLPENAAELALILGQPDGGGHRLTVQRPHEGAADDFFELRIDPSEPVTAAVTDVTELHRLDAAIAALGNATVTIDSESNLMWRPFGNARRYGVTDQDVLGARVLEWAHPEELPFLLEQFGRLLREPGRKESDVIRMRHPHIEGGWLRTRLTAVNCLKDPALRAVVLRTEDAAPVDMVEDITITTGPFRSLAEVAPVGILVADRNGAALYHNELARELLELDYDVVGRTDWLSHLGSDTVDQLEGVLNRARKDLVPGSVVISIERGASRPRFVRVDAVPQLDETGRAFGMVATLLDVTSETEARAALSEARDRLWHLATHDPLTSLANRVLFRERLERALAERAGGDHGVALLYCDLNGFKSVNDRFGHAFGDLVLKIVAQRLSGVVRGSDLVGRYGGDEFLVLCRGSTDTSEVEALTTRLIEAVSAPIRVDDEDVEIGMTVGVAVATGPTRVDDLIGEADRNMYASKAAGQPPA